MQRRKRLICALLCVCLCLSCCAKADTSVLDQKIDDAFQRFSTLGGCVAVFQNGEITYTHTYGVERIGGDDIQPETLFQVGSISKMVANIGLMQLLDEQNLSLDAELGNVLGYPIRHPDFPDIPVTLRQLMTHTASLRDSADYRDGLKGEGKTLADLFGRRSEYTFLQKVIPGGKRSYSNFGGGMIGSLIEKLSGKSVDAYMKENVFDPLGVTAAYQASLLPKGRHLAAMYQMPERRIAKDLYKDSSHETEPDPESHYWLTAGKLIISAPDLAKLLIVLCDGGVYQNTRLLKESTVAEMLAPQDYRGSVICATGNGLFINIVSDAEVEGRTLYGHGGKAYGMLCAAYFDITDRTGVVMLTNGCRNDSMYNGVGALGRIILSLCYEHFINLEHTFEDPFAVE